MTTRKLFICNGTGNGKSTLLAKMRDANYSNVVLHENTSATALGKSQNKDFNQRQTMLIQHIWGEQMGGAKKDDTLHVYDRSVLDYLDGSLRSDCPKAYTAAIGRWHNNVATGTMEFWDGCTFVVAPTPTIALMKANSDVYVGGKRGDYWRKELKAPEGLGYHDLLARIHEQMCRSEAWITAQLKYIQYRASLCGANVQVVNFNETHPAVYDRNTNFFKWQDLAMATMDATLRGHGGKHTL